MATTSTLQRASDRINSANYASRPTFTRPTPARRLKTLEENQATKALNAQFQQQAFAQLYPNRKAEELTPTEALNIASTAKLNTRLAATLTQRKSLTAQRLQGLMNNINLAVQLYERAITPQHREKHQPQLDPSIDPNSPTSTLFLLQMGGDTVTADRNNMLAAMQLEAAEAERLNTESANTIRANLEQNEALMALDDEEALVETTEAATGMRPEPGFQRDEEDAEEMLDEETKRTEEANTEDTEAHKEDTSALDDFKEAFDKIDKQLEHAGKSDKTGKALLKDAEKALSHDHSKTSTPRLERS